MRKIPFTAIAVLIAGLAAPAFAQDDPHHPTSTDTPAVEAPADNAAGDTGTKCPDPMGGMMGMMGGMQPGMGGSPQMQMMAMMQMMQQMQMMQMRMMQQMQMGMAAPQAPAEGGSP